MLDCNGVRHEEPQVRIPPHYELSKTAANLDIVSPVARYLSRVTRGDRLILRDTGRSDHSHFRRLVDARKLTLDLSVRTPGYRHADRGQRDQSPDRPTVLEEHYSAFCEE